MRPTHRYTYFALVSALGLPACSDDKSDDTGASSTSTPLTTTDTGTTAAVPTSGTSDPTDSGTTGTGMTDTGTSGPEPTTGEVSDPALFEQCKANYADAAEIAKTQCMCFVASGDYPDLDSCLAQLQTPPVGTTPEEADCTCEVYPKHPETSAILDCIGPLQKTFLDCLAEVGCDQAAQGQCYSEYTELMFECPDPSMAVEGQIAECLGEPLFVCDSGDQQIPEFLKCDGVSDCDDDSDEAMCG